MRRRRRFSRRLFGLRLIRLKIIVRSLPLILFSANQPIKFRNDNKLKKRPGNKNRNKNSSSISQHIRTNKKDNNNFAKERSNIFKMM